MLQSRVVIQHSCAVRASNRVISPWRQQLGSRRTRLHDLQRYGSLESPCLVLSTVLVCSQRLPVYWGRRAAEDTEAPVSTQQLEDAVEMFMKRQAELESGGK